MMRTMHGTSCDVRKEWLAWLRCLLHTHPRNRFINNVFCHVIVVATFIWHHRCRLVEHRWFPLRCFCIQDSIEAFKAKPSRPPIEWSSKCLLPQRCKVPLAECASGITRLLQNFSNTCCLFWNDAVVSGKYVCAFRNATHVHRVMITSCEHCCTRRRTQCRGVELIESQSVCRNSIKCWRWHWTTKCSTRTEAHIIEQDEHDIRRTSWRRCKT